jgi:hypothetical protein
MRRLSLYLGISLLLLVAPRAFGQVGPVVCWQDTLGAPDTWDPNGCLLTGTTQTWFSYYNEPYPTNLSPTLTVFSNQYNMFLTVSGTLTGDVGRPIYPSFFVTSFPCSAIEIPPSWGGLGGATAYSAGVHEATATYTDCDTGQVYSQSLQIVALLTPPSTTPTPCSSPSLIDPVASQLLSGNAVTTNTGYIAGLANPSYVAGAAADGVTQVLVEVPAAQAGDTVELTLLNENNQQDTVTNDGGLFALGGGPTSAASTISIQAQNTSSPMAFAIYKTASNFYRGSQDAATAVRNLTLQATCSSAGGAPTTVPMPMSLVRPPVVLVHGVWSDPTQAWSNFTPVNATNLQLWGSIGVQNPQYSLYKYPVNYSAPVSVTATVPTYHGIGSTVSGSAVGFAYNAGIVQSQTLLAIADFEDHYNVAAVQADVVAHSMGGDIARVVGGLGAFAGQSNYGFGPIHKLITIGTPHQGTPLLVDLLPGTSGDPNRCVRNLLTTFGDVSLQSETISGVSFNGAVGDIAAAPSNLPATEPFPMAFLAGSTNSNSLSGLGNKGAGLVLFTVCGTLAGDPLAVDLGQNYWTLLVFSNAANDGMVPVTSQLNTGQANGTTSTTANTLSGVIHSPGIELLGFNPPSEVDPSSGIPDAVVNLLNEATNGTDFH